MSQTNVDGATIFEVIRLSTDVFVRLVRYNEPGLEVIKLEYSSKLKIKRNDWLLADTCPQAANHCALF